MNQSKKIQEEVDLKDENDLHTQVHSCIIHNSQEVETIQISSVDEWMSIHPMEYYSALKKEERKSWHRLQHRGTLSTLC